jgi:hypothetical protein
VFLGCKASLTLVDRLGIEVDHTGWDLLLLISMMKYYDEYRVINRG